MRMTGLSCDLRERQDETSSYVVFYLRSDDRGDDWEESSGRTSMASIFKRQDERNRLATVERMKDSWLNQQ